MDFKLETKPTYTVITPLSTALDAALTVKLRQKWNNFAEQGSLNFIVDLQHCHQAEETALVSLVDWHEEVYTHQCSLIFTLVSPKVMELFKRMELEQVLNITPTLIEAIDMVSMEILERDLFGEEEAS